MKVLPFRTGPVPFLWAPRTSDGRRVSPAWRVLTGAGSVVTMSAPDPARRWHVLAQRYMDKYGADWTCRDGFDMAALTPAERREYVATKRQVRDARRR